MKSIFYLLTILFLSLLISCSEEPPTSVDVESLSKKPIKDPQPNLDPLDLDAGVVHIVGVTTETIRNKSRSSFRVWSGTGTTFDPEPQIREFEGTLTKVAIYDNNGAVELLVYNYYTIGKNRNRVEHFELQIWRDRADPEIYNLDGFLYLDIAIGELDGDPGDEIVLGGFNTLLGRPEIRVYDHNYGDFSAPIKTFPVGAYGYSGRPVVIGNVAGNAANEIIFRNSRGIIAVLDYSSGNVIPYTIPNNEQLNAIAVGYVENGLDEIIWGGNSGEVHILEFNETNSNFEPKWESENLGSWIHNIAAGDFAGDSKYEIAVATASTTENPSIIYVFDYVVVQSPPYFDYTKTMIDEIPEGVTSMFAGNADNDPALKKDIVVGTRTNVKAYDGLSNYTPFFDVPTGAIVSEVYLK